MKMTGEGEDKRNCAKNDKPNGGNHTIVYEPGKISFKSSLTGQLKGLGQVPVDPQDHFVQSSKMLFVELKNQARQVGKLVLGFFAVQRL